MARFVDEYLIDLNATQAAIRAGYSEKTANVQGPRLLVNVRVARAIAEAKAERTVAAGITRERVLKELESLAFSSHTHFMQDDNTGRLVLSPGAPESAHAAVSSVKYRTTSYGGGDGPPTIVREVEFKLWDKPGPLKLAGRHVDAKGFWDRMEVTGKDGGPVRSEVSGLTTDETKLRVGELAALARSRMAGAPDTPGESKVDDGALSDPE